MNVENGKKKVLVSQTTENRIDLSECSLAQWFIYLELTVYFIQNVVTYCCQAVLVMIHWHLYHIIFKHDEIEKLQMIMLLKYLTHNAFRFSAYIDKDIHLHYPNT